MTDVTFRILFVAGIVFSIIMSRINKRKGGLFAFIITTVVLVLGLNGFYKPGWELSFFGVTISPTVFLVIVALWYAFDIYQLIVAQKAFKYFFLSWLVPGLGHFLQKKYLKGTVFLTGILMLLVFGLLMQGKFYDTKQLHPLLILGFLGDLGNGLFYLFIKIVGLGKGNIEAVTYHYGTTYMVSAGLLNYLVALNAFDIARGKRK